MPQAAKAFQRCIVTRSERPNQVATATLQTLEQRLTVLEEDGRYECAYALRMEIADWLLGSKDANLAAPSLS